MPFAQDQAVWFPQWAEALAQLRLPALHREQYRQALIRYLRYCKETRQPATIAAARAFIASVQTQGLLGVSALALWKDALNWSSAKGASRRQAENGKFAKRFPSSRPSPQGEGESFSISRQFARLDLADGQSASESGAEDTRRRSATAGHPRIARRVLECGAFTAAFAPASGQSEVVWFIFAGFEANSLL